MSWKSLEDTVAFYEESEDSLLTELAMATTESTQLGQWFDSLRADVINVQRKLAARDADVRSFAGGWCATLGSSG